LTADEEALISIEGLEMMTQFLSLIKKDKFEADYVPNVDRMIKKLLDPVTADEVRVRMAMIIGKIVDGFSSFMLATKYQGMFLDMFR
jgi:hypothetical protein